MNRERTKKKARPGEATPRRAEMEAGTGQATTSMTDFNTSGASGQGIHIAAFLSYGPENGVTLRHLEKLTDLPGREIRRQIARERLAGVQIISDNQHGYYLTDDPGEAQRFARSMKHRARQILQTARAVERGAGLD